MLCGIRLGRIYKHYKRGDLYRVMHLAKHTETQETMVVYKSLWPIKDHMPVDEPIWVRSLKEFRETPEVAGRPVPRFDLITAAEAFKLIQESDEIRYLKEADEIKMQKRYGPGAKE